MQDKVVSCFFQGTSHPIWNALSMSVHSHGNSKLPVFLDQTSPVIKRKKFLFVCTGYMAHSLKKCMVSTSGCWSKSLSSKGSRKAHIPLGSCCTESDTAQKVFCFCVVHTSMQSNLSLRCTKMHAMPCIFLDSLH